jgi:hypothetical protein
MTGDLELTTNVKTRQALFRMSQTFLAQPAGDSCVGGPRCDARNLQFWGAATFPCGVVRAMLGRVISTRGRNQPLLFVVYVQALWSNMIDCAKVQS